MKCTLLLALLCFSVTCTAGYSVTGNKLYDPNGALVRLRGVDRPGFEWSTTGSSASLSDYTLMRTWGSNVVRISTNQDFWLAASTYATAIDLQITWANSVGMGVILDLHWNQGAQQNMADRNSITFWSQVAARYKNNPWVMFELYNEPHDITWSQWLNGDATYAGMQEMYDAVRATGATNVVVVGGLNWAFDLSGVGAGYDVQGTNIVYATHPYDYGGKQIADWPAGFGYLAATYPVIMTEFGQYCATNTYVSDLLTYAESLGIHWTAWAWFVSGCAFPSIISDWNGTPAPGVGVLVKSYLSGYAPTGIPTPAPIVADPLALSIYADALNANWEDWSWSSSYSLADTTYVHSGSKAIRFELVSFQGVYFHALTTFQIGSYSQLVLWVNGGTSTKPGGDVAITLYGSNQLNVGISVNFGANANQWSQVVIPISYFGVTADTAISGIVFQSNIDTPSAGFIYMDDIYFAAGAGATSSPTTAPTSAPTHAPTSAPTNAPTRPPTTAPTHAPTSAPTSAPTTAPTNEPTTTPTHAPTSAPTTAPTIAPTHSPGTCDASSVYFVHTIENSWESGGKTFVQYNLEVHNTCSNKYLTGITIAVTNWNVINYWNILTTSTSNILTLPSYAYGASASNPFVAGYISSAGQASFTAVTAIFQ